MAIRAPKVASCVSFMPIGSAKGEQGAREMLQTRSRFARDLAGLAGLSLVYILSGKLGLRLAFVNASTTAVWPPTGIALAALLLLGYRVWPAILVGAFVVNLTATGSITTSIAIATGNTLEGLTAAYLVTQLARGREAFNRVQDVLRFATLAGILSPMVAATAGVTSLFLAGYARAADYQSVWITWWLGDAAGALVVAPLLILWGTQPYKHWNRTRTLEAVLLVACIIGVGQVIFWGPKNYPLIFLSIPLLMWAAFRFSPREAVTANFLLSAISVWGTLHRFGTLNGEAINQALLLLQSYLAVLAVTTLSLSAAVSERNAQEEEVRKARDGLEMRVRERTAALAAEVAERRSAEQMLRRLSAHVLQSQDEERRRIARELHDSVGQYLTALKLNLQNLGNHTPVAKNEAPAGVAACVDLVESCLAEVRTVSYLLHSPVLDFVGLAAAIKDYADGFAKRSGIKVQVDVPEDLSRLPQDLETALFRILQEALTNVHRHSTSTVAKIRLIRELETITLEIADEGKGISGLPGTEAGGGVGIAGMRERMKELGGRLEIDSSPEGTIIRAVAGVQAARAKAGPPLSRGASLARDQPIGPGS